MNALRFTRLAVALVLALPVVAVADGGAVFLSENFDATTVTANVSVPTGWTFGTDSTPLGVAQNNDSQYDVDSGSFVTPRTCISTVAADFNTVDFTYETTFSVGGGGDGIAFFGIGSGQPNPDFHGEPYEAFFLRQFPEGFGRGATGWTISTRSSARAAEAGHRSDASFGTSVATRVCRLISLGSRSPPVGGGHSEDSEVLRDVLLEPFRPPDGAGRAAPRRRHQLTKPERSICQARDVSGLGLRGVGCARRPAG